MSEASRQRREGVTAYLPARTALTRFAPALTSLWTAVHVKQTSCTELLDVLIGLPG